MNKLHASTDEGLTYIGKDNLAYAHSSNNYVTAPNDNSAVTPELLPAVLSSNETVVATGTNAGSARDATSHMPADTENAPALQRNVGLFGALSLIIGCMIGSGIFASGSTVASRSGSTGMILCVWSGCGLLATLGALCYAELGTAIPKSGSEHSYLSYAFGDIGGFMYTWVSTLVIKPSGQAGICVAFGAYVVEAFGSLSLCAMEKNQLTKIFAAFAIGKIRTRAIY